MVNVVSTAGLVGVPFISPYTYAKAGAVALTRTAAYEYAKDNIRVNAVAPGTTLTPLMKSYAASGGDGARYLEIAENANPIPAASPGTPSRWKEASSPWASRSEVTD